jgi:hypothetical protein
VIVLNVLRKEDGNMKRIGGTAGFSQKTSRFGFVMVLVASFAVATMSLTTVLAFNPPNSPFNATNQLPDCPPGGALPLPGPGGAQVTVSCTPTGGTQAVDVTWIPDNPSGNDDNSWVQGTSSDCFIAKGAPGDGACVTRGQGSVPPKNELEILGVGLEKDTVAGSSSLNDVFFYGGINRAAAGGINSSNANYNIEINQELAGYAPAAPICTGANPGSACNRYRSPGDKVMMIDWGGSTASCSTRDLTVSTPAVCVYTWIDTGGPTPNSGTCFNAKAAPCWGNVVPLSIGGTVAAGSIAADSRFSEISINLTDAGLIQTGTCVFGKQVVASARSSSSFTAEEKDVIFGDVELSTCSATTTTLQRVVCPNGANDGAAAKELSANIPVGGSVCVKDIASVTGGATTGDVLFKTYTATTGGTPKTALANCTDDTNGTPVSTNGLTGTPATATSSTVAFTTAGTYYWKAFYQGGGGFSASTSPCDEILTLRQNTSTATLLHQRTNSTGDTDVNPSNNGLAIDVVPPAFVNDVATVTGGTPSGAVTFRYYTGADAAAALAACEAGAQSEANPTGTGGTGAGTGIAVSGGTATSSTITFSTTGYFYWRAFFVGSGSFNNSQSPCNEIVHVLAVDTAIATTPWVFPNDKATISAPNGGGDLTGSVNFKLYETEANCLANGATGLKFAQTITLGAGGGSKDANTTNGDTTSTATKTADYKVEADTTVWWRVFFDSTNVAQNDSLSNCVEKIAVVLTPSP